MAKQLRLENKEIKPHIRFVQNDYRLFAKNRNDPTKWNDTKPYVIPITIPEFEICKLSNSDKIKETIRNNEIRDKQTEKIDNKRDRHELISNTSAKKPHNMSDDNISDSNV